MVDEAAAEACRVAGPAVQRELGCIVQCSVVVDGGAGSAGAAAAPPPRNKCTLCHFIRHGEGTHNVAQREWRARAVWDGQSQPYSVDNDPEGKYEDAELTSLGEQEARALQSRTNSLSPELLVVSPLRRATKTGLLAFEVHVRDRQLPVLANEWCHETGGKYTCDKRLSRACLQRAFPDVDYSELTTDEDPYWGDDNIPEKWDDLCLRAGRFVRWAGELLRIPIPLLL